MKKTELKQGLKLTGPIFNEPVEVILSVPFGNAVKLYAKGLNTSMTYDPILTDEQIDMLTTLNDQITYSGNAKKFRLNIEALRLGLAYEYDPYFSLSIARIDPLPHQLEAVYDYFLKLPRIRFLLADDPGAGKTIMAGLLIKELKIRGLIKRILIVAPANLTFQWQREMKDKFREDFKVIRGDVLRANYGSNPWQEEDQVVTSVSWVSVIEDANQSLLRSRWDLIIVDEAHRMSAYSSDRTTMAYKLGKELSKMTDHYLLMTATPHKGDPENFRLFLELLDADVYGDIASLNKGMLQKYAPYYLRRVKEALVSFPDPVTGEVKQLFTKRNVNTAGFKLNDDEYEFYDELTQYVEDQSIKAAEADTVQGRVIGFTMAMLQRRFASSIYAARRSLERMRDKRQHILDDPEAYRKEQMLKKIPDDFEDLPDEEQQDIMAKLEEAVASVDPAMLREEIIRLEKLIKDALHLEAKEIETKLTKLKDVMTKEGLFKDPKMKLLIFTEHKDTLDYLVKKLQEWNLSVTQICGGMKIGDRDTPGTRIYAEREFRETCQVLVATEAAGEGINLQFCWFMINYDIPWNPMRLEQRMGRIHRYGQEKDCLIINFVSTNTREGRVMDKLLSRIKEIEIDLDPNKTGSVFNVMGEVFSANLLEKMLRDMYARNATEKVITDRIVKEVDIERFRSITKSTLEGLAKRELNLSVILSKAAEAKERKLVPEVIEDFFIQSADYVSISPKQISDNAHIYRVGTLNRTLINLGNTLEQKYGKLGREYSKVVFDKEYLKKDATLEWVTPGHPLFEVVRSQILETTKGDVISGAVFYDVYRKLAASLEVYTATIVDGRNNVLHRRLFVVETQLDGTMTLRQPTLFLDLIPAVPPLKMPELQKRVTQTEQEVFLIEKALNPLLFEVSKEREKEVGIIKAHLELSLNELIKRENIRYAEVLERQEKGDLSTGTQQALRNSEERLDELSNRLDNRLRDLAMETNFAISDIRHLGSAWVLPHPDQNTTEMLAMQKSDLIEKIAVEVVIKHEKAQGREVLSVESENRGFDLISRKPNPQDPKTAIDIRFIEVKGRAGVGEVALTYNEYKTAERLKKDYWLYVVYNCNQNPRVHIIQDPATRLDWEPLVKIEHYHVGAEKILEEGKQ